MLLSGKVKSSCFFFLGALLLLSVATTSCKEDEKFSGIPTIASQFSAPTPQATITRFPTLTPVHHETATPGLSLKTVVIFDDGFKNGWGLIGNDLFSEITEELTYDGDTSIKITPRLGFSRFYIISETENSPSIRREDIITVSFYLNGGSTPIGPEDMTITAQGSNTNTIWVQNDRSAIVESGISFSETQLAFLGISVIPADTWARLEFLPQEQEFDPFYTNFTGFYLSNSASLMTPYYIDRIEILMIDG
ncbi:MAG: hypothetical protein ACI9EW_001187 [Cellvibrionaceae bacterium]|jgi:hypothetical protein